MIPNGRIFSKIILAMLCSSITYLKIAWAKCSCLEGGREKENFALWNFTEQTPREKKKTKQKFGFFEVNAKIKNFICQYIKKHRDPSLFYSSPQSFTQFLEIFLCRKGSSLFSLLCDIQKPVFTHLLKEWQGLGRWEGLRGLYILLYFISHRNVFSSILIAHIGTRDQWHYTPHTSLLEKADVATIVLLYSTWILH